MSRLSTLLLSAGALLACAAPGFAADPAALLPANSTPLLKLSANAAAYAAMSTVTVANQPFPSAVRVEVTKKPQRANEVMVSASTEGPIANGDVLLVTFWARSGKPGEATLDAGFRATPGAAPAAAPGGAAPNPFVGGFSGGRGGGLSQASNLGPAWKKFQYPFSVTREYPKGAAEVTFTLGMAEQTVEIGGVELANYGTTKKVTELPFTKYVYPGSEPDAPWRKAAETRIEKERKGDLTVVVKDKAGKPVRNAEVSVRMKKHAFLWGTAVAAASFSNGRMTPENLDRYKKEILKYFNCAVMENENKWPEWSRVENRPKTIAVIDWLRENGVQVRGHNLVWPSWSNTNVKEVRDAKNDPAALAKIIVDHIAETTKQLRGKFVDWDVMNEPFTNHDFMDILGKQAMVDWFKAAKAGDPEAKLYINDFNILEGTDTAHQNHYAETIKYLIDNGAPVEGIGLQSHFSGRLTPFDELIRRMDRYAAFNRELEVTEFDINTSDEAGQADYTRDFMTLTFSYPQVKAFVMWGFWEGAHWLPKGAMMRRDWSPKPNLAAYTDLVFNKWWTNANGKTTAQGAYNVRGFLGDYEVEVKANGKTKTVKASLPKAGAKVECVLD